MCAEALEIVIWPYGLCTLLYSGRQKLSVMQGIGSKLGDGREKYGPRRLSPNWSNQTGEGDGLDSVACRTVGADCR